MTFFYYTCAHAEYCFLGLCLLYVFFLTHIDTNIPAAGEQQG